MSKRMLVSGLVAVGIVSVSLMGYSAVTNNAKSTGKSTLVIKESTSETVKNETKKIVLDEDGNLNGVPLNNIRWYWSDEHYVEDAEATFQGINAYGPGNNTFGLKVGEAKASDNIADHGEYFVAIQDELEEQLHWCIDVGLSKEEVTFLSVPVEITNTEEYAAELCVGNISLVARIADERLVEYGFADGYLDSMGPTSSVFHDYKYQTDNSTDMEQDYYMINIEPGQTISTTLLYVVEKQDLAKDIYFYFEVGSGGEPYNTEYKFELPPIDTELYRCVRVRLDGDYSSIAKEFENAEEDITVYTEPESEYVNGVHNQMIYFYVADEHFYDETELDFINDEENFKIKVGEATVSDDLSVFGDYFVEAEPETHSQTDIADEDLTYISVPVEITNTGSESAKLYLDDLEMAVRIADDRLVDYFDVDDQYVLNPSPKANLYYDFGNRDTSADNYRREVIEAGETISTQLVYIIEKEYADGDLYLKLYAAEQDGGYIDGYRMPPTDENLKYIKVNVKTEN